MMGGLAGPHLGVEARGTFHIGHGHRCVIKIAQPNGRCGPVCLLTGSSRVTLSGAITFKGLPEIGGVPTSCQIYLSGCGRHFCAGGACMEACWGGANFMAHPSNR